MAVIIGPFAWRRRFDPRAATDVFLEPTRATAEGGTAPGVPVILVRRGAKDLRFGSMLSEERRRYLAAVLRRELLEGTGDPTAARSA